MRRSSCIVAVTFALAAHAGEPLDLSTHGKAAVVPAGAAALRQPAPFTAAHEPIPDFLPHEEVLAPLPRSACERARSDVCYDLAEARIVYRPARAYMPRLGPLTPESVSVRHHGILFKYSF